MTVVDAAALTSDATASTGDGVFASPRLVAFVRDLARYATDRDERTARAACRAPYSGLPSLDARALCVAAGERRSLAETIARELVPLAHESALAARRFVRALERLADASTAQGACASEFVAALQLAFEFDARLDEAERTTLAAIVALAARVDREQAPGSGWDPAILAAALAAAAHHGPRATAPVEMLPLPRREPEAPRVVRRRTTTFSASSLGTFAECERRWYFRYVCAAIEDRGSSASFYGIAFHWALERFHQTYARADAADPPTLQQSLATHLNTAFERYRASFATTVEYELQRRRAQRTGVRYLAWFLERARQRPFTVIGTETTVRLELDGHAFIGYVDRLDRDDATGGVTVIDYKTGSIAESAEAYRANVARFVDFQLPFYYFARTAEGDRVTSLALVPLKDAALDVEPLELEVLPVAARQAYGGGAAGVIGIDELERARAKMTELAATLADAPLETFAPTSDPEACGYCAYVVACRDRPARRDDRFGR